MVNLINHGLSSPTATSHIKTIFDCSLYYSFKNSHMHTWCRLRNITSHFFYLLWSHLWSNICPCINTDGRHVKWQLPGEVWTISFLIIGERSSINIELVLIHNCVVLFYITLHLWLKTIIMLCTCITSLCLLVSKFPLCQGKEKEKPILQMPCWDHCAPHCTCSTCIWCGLLSRWFGKLLNK